jgi:hypothetical protein
MAHASTTATFGPVAIVTRTKLPHTACSHPTDIHPTAACPLGRLVRDVEVAGPDEFGLMTHVCTIHYMDRDGNMSRLCWDIFTVWPDGSVFDEDGEDFPDVETASNTHIGRVLDHLRPPAE